jgi:hypothetical protein
MNNFAKSISLNGEGSVAFLSGQEGVVVQYALSNNQWIFKEIITPSVSSLQYVGITRITSLECNKNNTVLSAVIKNDYNAYILIFEYNGVSWSEVFVQQLSANNPETGKIYMHFEEDYIAITDSIGRQKFLQIIKKDNNAWAFDQTIGDDEHGKINKNGEIIFIKKQGNAIFSGSLDSQILPEVKVTNLIQYSDKILAISGDGNICAIEQDNNINFYRKKNNTWSLYLNKQKETQQKIKNVLINNNGSRFGVVSENNRNKLEVFEINENKILPIDKPLFNQQPNSKQNFAEDFACDEDMSVFAVSEEDVGVSFFEIKAERKSIKIVDVEYDFGDTVWFSKEAYRLNQEDFPVETKGVLLTNEKRILLVNNKASNSELISYFPELENEDALFKPKKEFTNKYNNIWMGSETQPFNYETNWYYEGEESILIGLKDPITGKIELQSNEKPKRRDETEGGKAMFQKFIPKNSESDEHLSPWGSRKGIYEFINSITIDEFNAQNLIQRKTENIVGDPKRNPFCKTLHNRRNAGYCKPRSIGRKANVAKDGFLNKDNLYGKNFIESGAASETRIESDFFYDMTINSFWKNFITLIKENKGLLLYAYDYYTKKNQWRFEQPNQRSKILSEELVDFLVDRMGSIPTVEYSQDYCEENNIEYDGTYDGVNVLDVQSFTAKNKLLEGRSGYNNPYIGYNQDGHFIKRRLIFMPLKKVVFLDKDDPIGLFENQLDALILETNEYVAVVEWSVNYSDVFGKKHDPPIARKYYHINEDFFYRGFNYDVYSNFPFKDFNMLPVRWTDKKTEYISTP